MFYLAGVIGTNFGVGFTVAGFWPAFWGAMIVSAISFILNIFIKDDRHR
jgi:putative membrane protein